MNRKLHIRLMKKVAVAGASPFTTNATEASFSARAVIGNTIALEIRSRTSLLRKKMAVSVVAHGWLLLHTIERERTMALDQQETFNQLVRQNSAMREAIEKARGRLEVWRKPGNVAEEVITNLSKALAVK
jgi:hypothetical protein